MRPSLPDARDEGFINLALEIAREADRQGDVPVGALVVRGDLIIARAANRTVRDQDPTAHAEILATRLAAGVLGSARLTDCDLYVTLEPCAMCAGAIVQARYRRLVFAAFDDKAGMCGSLADLVRHPKLNHRPEVRAGVLATDASLVLRDFFARRRGSERP